MILVTGSAGHLGAALLRTLRASARPCRGLARLASPFTDVGGSIVDPEVVDRAMAGCDQVIHAATLHKPHVATHARQAFVDTNVTGTLNLLEAADAHLIALERAPTLVFGRFIITATTPFVREDAGELRRDPEAVLTRQP